MSDHFEPHRYQEVVAKKAIVNNMINQTLAEAGDLIYQITQVSKSAALALTLLYQEGENRLSLEQAVNIARVDEHF